METIYGTARFYGEAKPLKNYGKGRTCARRGCRTMLSQYNPLSVCELCQKNVVAPATDCLRVPAGPSMRALRSLRHIISRQRTAELTGISVNTLDRISQGHSRTVEQSIEERILEIANIGRRR